jgi:hypothetical protein
MSTPPLPSLWKIAGLAALVLLSAAAAPAAIKQEIPPLRPPREDPLPASVDRRDPLPWFLAAGAAAVLAAIIAWPRQPKRKIVEPPAARARRELRALATPTPLSVSHVLRHYLVATFPAPGEGVTTEEISAVLAGSMADQPALAAEITDFLAACDAAKFAPVPDASPTNYTENALALIDRVESRNASARAAQPTQPALSS